MKANELMIGDWVMLDGKEPKQITGLKTHSCKHGYVQIKNIDCSAEYLEPIPLTPEILEKNGFSENYRAHDLSYAQSCGDVIGIHIYGTNGLMEEMYFKYVHELQHALRLCGIEKEIKL